MRISDRPASARVGRPERADEDGSVTARPPMRAGGEKWTEQPGDSVQGKAERGMTMEAKSASRLRLGAVTLTIAASLLFGGPDAQATGNPTPTGCSGGVVINGGTSTHTTNI